MKKQKYYIGIDTGVITGYAIYEPATRSLGVYSDQIHYVMEIVKDLWKMQSIIKVRVEDPRLAVYGRKFDQHRLRGAGSVMRDAKIWEDFLKDQGIPYEMVRPQKALTKMSAQKFKQFTGYVGRTNEHGRDAAMLVYGY